jgi:SSS family solute:Na+ symporter
MPPVMQTLDWLLLGLYALAVVALGFAARHRQRDSEEFLLGGRALPWPLVGVSILATAFSAASLLGGPGEAFAHGMLWMQLQIGDLLAILIVIWIFLPFLRGLTLDTAYEYLERRFGLAARLFGSALFHLQVIFRTGILLYGPALALATVTGIDVRLAIVVVGIVATLYTVMGGITAVVWTDALQLGIVLLGVGLSAAIIASLLPGGFRGAFAIAAEAGRLEWIDPEQPLSSVRSFWGAAIGYGILSLSVAGTNQQPVQRYLSCESVAAARRAALLGWAVGAVITLMTLGLGVLLFAYYRANPGSIAEGLSGDAIFPHFIATELPAGVKGLLVAAIFAAAMSSLDSALNAMSSATLCDFHDRLGASRASEEQRLRLARRWTIIWGIVGIAAGLYVAGRGSLLAMAVRYVGYFAGPILGLFLLGFLSPKTGERAALWGCGISFAGVLFLVKAPEWWGIQLPFQGIWLAAGGTLLTLLAGLIASFFCPPPRREQLDGLCRGHDAAP